MPTTKSLPASLVKTKVAGAKLLTPFQPLVDALPTMAIISKLDGEKIQVFIVEGGELLTSIRQARQEWSGKIEPVLAPLREAKQAADALNREIDRPLEEYERRVRDTLRFLRMEEDRRVQESRRLQTEKEETLRKELEATSEREQAARTKQMRERLASRRMELETTLEEQAPPVAQVEAVGSSIRRVKKWKIVDQLAMFRGVAQNKIPSMVLQTNSAFINAQPIDKVAEWPGFEVYEDVQIVAKR